MKKRLFLILMACCMVTNAAWAGSINQQQARTIASSFMASRAKDASSLKISHKQLRQGASTAVDKASYYVFNASRASDGFVIVAGDDRVPAVLGYCDNGSFDVNNVPEALQALLDSYAAQIEALDEGAMPSLRDTQREPIAPMLTTEWGQGSPYNAKLPFAGSSHALTGAATTAMAQVMHYYRWPERPSSVIPAYVTSSLSISMPQLPIVNFDWDMMNATYMSNDTAGTSIDAVAQLMLYCAQGQTLDFKSGSTNTSVPKASLALTTYFGYQPSVTTLSRANYSTREWEDIIYNELAEQHPVIYGAYKGNYSQVFVCDGYDGQGMFHINWCLHGQYNGYYLLNLLNIDNVGTGSAGWASGFVENQSALVGLRPGSTEYAKMELTSSKVTLHSYNPTRPAFADFFEAVVTGTFNNYTTRTFSIDTGWGLFRDDELVVNISGAYVKSMSPGSYINNKETLLRFGYMVPDGTYQIRQMYSAHNLYTWHWCVGADKNYLEVVIRGDSCFITPHGNACPANVSVNRVTTQGNMHPNRPIDISVNVTNNGESMYSYMYMFVNGTKTATGLMSVDQGDSTDVMFRYFPTAVGDYALSFSFNEDGSDPIATDTLHIVAMPVASLGATLVPLNVTDATHSVITDDKFRVQLIVTNKKTTPYDEDISVALFKLYHNSYTTQTHAVNRHITLDAGATDTLLFEMDDVVDGWRYFVKAYCYSNGNKVELKTSATYTLEFPKEKHEVMTDIVPADGGEVTFMNGVSDGLAEVDKPVIFTVTPNAGYELLNVTVTSESGETVATTLDNGNYRFVMPTEPVTVHVTFIAIHAVGVTDNVTAGGVVAVSANQVRVGDEVTVTATPNVGWSLQGITVMVGDSAIAVTETDGIGHFIMPDGDVTVSADFVRATRDRFELVTSRDDITADGIYMLANKPNDRAMKFYKASERAFRGTVAGEWIDEDKSLLIIDDQVCMFTIDDLSIDTIDNGKTTEVYVTGYLNTGNGYLMSMDELVGLSNEANNRCLVYLSLNDSTADCQLNFPETISQNKRLSYNSSFDWFMMMTYADDAQQQVWLYKLVDEYAVTVIDSEGGLVTVTGGTIDGKAQRGVTITATVVPDEGYNLVGVAVTTAAGDEVEVTVDEETGVYSFVMPGSDVTIAATFELPIERGDVNGDHEISIADVTLLINYLLTGDDEGIFLAVADCNQDEEVGIADVTDLINYLLTGFWPADNGQTDE